MSAQRVRPVSGLFTDLYELTMVQAYLAEGLNQPALFSLFARRLPERRNYLVACGLDTVLTDLARLRFTGEDLSYLRSLGRFSEPTLGWLAKFRFSGDVYAVPEGTPVFADEPLVEIAAPLAEAQLVETLVMNGIHVQTVLASKAARVVTAAAGRPVVDFGARRAHGVEAAVQGARAFHIAGVSATSNVLAGRTYGLPVSGTMAHSYVQAHGDERAAFRAFARAFPGTTLLVDTYDTIEGVRRAIELMRSDDPIEVGAIRLDSGDLAALACESRRLLDAAGLAEVRIVASSGLDEDAIARLVASGAPIDAFGVGTGMIVSSDAASLDLAYKLTEFAGRGRTKLSPGKPVYPGRKQVFRRAEDDGRFVGDVLACADESQEGEPLLRLVMRGGARVDDEDFSVGAARLCAAEALGRMPERITALEPADPPYRVEISRTLRALHEQVKKEGRA